ncbi:16S rRNA (cytosine(1402)-N(4))-methyltransferase [Candidatus Berkelbacteria bacterium]|nr:16S rRNA (cytosine(1402)-N(4))-methyltransferase [Candidatus Berkelbacteria bacterium]
MDQPLTHRPVMMDEVLSALDPRPGETVVDATLGLGGHAAEILKRIGPTGRLLGIERTSEGLSTARERLAASARQLVLVQADFRTLEEIVHDAAWEAVDGLLFDLGLASWQVDTGYRGLSFQVEAPLDLRLTPQRPQDFTSQDEDPSQWTRDAMLARVVRTWRFRSAAEFVNTAPEPYLAKALSGLGDVTSARTLAHRVVTGRPIHTTGELVTALGTRDPARLAPVFQALRILAGDEFGALVAGLRAGWRLLAPGGRLVVLSFHSGEDRIVKQFLRSVSVPTLRAHPSDAEQRANPRSRSATLRAATKPITDHEEE